MERNFNGRGGEPWREREARALNDLEVAVLGACEAEAQWPAQIAAGVYAAVNFAIANPEIAKAWVVGATADAESRGRYDRAIARLAGFVRVRAPVDSRMPGATDETLVAGIAGLVGDHLRLGHLKRLEDLRPEFALLTLLPYVGFDQARYWANWAAEEALSG